MAIFGKILYLPYSSGTIVFIDVLVVFTIFEGCKFESVFIFILHEFIIIFNIYFIVLHILEVECNKRGLKVSLNI